MRCDALERKLKIFTPFSTLVWASVRYRRRHPPASQLDNKSNFIRHFYDPIMFRWYFTTSMNFFTAFFSSSHDFMLKWHSVSLETTWNVWIYMLATRYKRATGEGELVFIDDEGSKRSVWFGDSWNMGEKFEKNYCSSARFSMCLFYLGSTRHRKNKRSMCNLMTQHRTRATPTRPGIWDLFQIPPHCLDTTQKNSCLHSGTCLGITQRQQSDMAEVQQSWISIIESISRSPIIGENPEA